MASEVISEHLIFLGEHALYILHVCVCTYQHMAVPVYKIAASLHLEVGGCSVVGLVVRALGSSSWIWFQQLLVFSTCGFHVPRKANLLNWFIGTNDLCTKISTVMCSISLQTETKNTSQAFLGLLCGYASSSQRSDLLKQSMRFICWNVKSPFTQARIVIMDYKFAKGHNLATVSLGISHAMHARSAPNTVHSIWGDLCVGVIHITVSTWRDLLAALYYFS